MRLVSLILFTDLLHNELEQIKDVVRPGIYALVKQNMSDATLSQPPIFAMQSSVAAAFQFPPTGSDHLP